MFSNTLQWNVIQDMWLTTLHHVCAVHWNVFDTLGEYHEYSLGISRIHWGGGGGGVQYTEGYHKYTWEYHD